MKKILLKLYHHKKITLLICLIFNIVLYTYNTFIGIIFSSFIIIILSGIVFFIILNKLYKKTNHFKNIFALCTDFVSNKGYRQNLARNYEVVNVGSNPARFAFFYEDVRGRNWSTGTQGLDMDLEILKFYHSFLKEGAYVILPIVPFSSVSGYLKRKPRTALYLSKFAYLLDALQIKYSKNFIGFNRRSYLTYPLIANPNAIVYLFKDTEKDTRLSISENPMGLIDMEQNARWWIEECWKPEFNIHSLHDDLTRELKDGFKLSVKMMKNIIVFLKERGYKPVIVSPPVSEALGKYFTPDVKERFVTSFANEFKDMDVPYLDYMHDPVFSNHEYYFNALFMNLRGRKAFTKKVLKDLNIRQ